MTNLSKIMKQGLMYPFRFVKGRTGKVQVSANQLTPGQGAIVEMNGEKVAVYKDNDGKTITLSPVCRHLGCFVGWNASEKTWDCPCHGSRYSAEGKVIKGPAKKDLDKKVV